MVTKSPGGKNKDYLIEKDGDIFYITCSGKEKRGKPCPVHRFHNFVEKDLATADRERHSRVRDVSRLQMFTFLVLNTGPNPVTCRAEMSPDGVNWDSFGESRYTVSPGGMQIIVPQYYLRFARLKYSNEKPGFNSVITIWFQGRGN